MVHMKVVKRVNSKCSHQIELNFSYFFDFASIWDDGCSLTCDIHFMMYVSQIIRLYTLNSYSAVHRLYLNKTRRKKTNKYQDQLIQEKERNWIYLIIYWCTTFLTHFRSHDLLLFTCNQNIRNKEEHWVFSDKWKTDSNYWWRVYDTIKMYLLRLLKILTLSTQHFIFLSLYKLYGVYF